MTRMSPARREVLDAARANRLLYRPREHATPEAWAINGRDVSNAARAATRAGLLEGPPARFTYVRLTESGTAALAGPEDETTT